MKFTRRTALTATAATAATAAIAGCGGSSGSSSDGGGDGNIELTVATFNEFGYEDLFTQYEEENPGVKITHKKAATADDARANLMTGLAAGSGLADVEGVEVGWWAELLQYSDVFEDLADPAVEGRWLDWKTEAATVDGKLIGYGTDIGPEAIAYRADLFEKAGLPTDRTEVAELLTGDWATYFDAGRQFVEATGIPWFDGAGGTYNGMVQQLTYPYEGEDGAPIPLAENADVKAIYDQLVEYKEISAGLTQWSEDWTAAFQNDGFATMLCPPWMMGPLSGNADGVEGWDIAGVFPGGGGNWGGSYLAVPSQGKNIEEAKKLAAWLTAPDQQIKAFEAVGAFPSQVEALEAEEVTSLTNPFFNDAPVGQIYSERATAIDVQPVMGPNFFVINTVVADAITRWDADGADPAGSWDQALSAYDELGLD
ncbi:ABC transporter substrate-binding protein [Brachybacterium aquaticum]|uniref:Cellobiose transport system substrate-binding protein n=1 Tax=Brachybacterium aquaticum TaxID=1432564 RepID=A0A841AD52_9MICO|nr:extracellular solute-binding protein [Brachybacterium aquaticum]MBB5831212.1 cellobiose transport system substrate-binding protein [Brachybacterium aquaticum]